VPTAEHVEEQEDFMVTREFNLMGHDTLPGVGAGIPDMLIGCDGPSQSLHHLTRYVGLLSNLVLCVCVVCVCCVCVVCVVCPEENITSHCLDI